MQSTRRGSFSVHRSEKTPGSKYSSTSGLSPRGHLETGKYYTDDTYTTEVTPQGTLIKWDTYEKIKDETLGTIEAWTNAIFVVISSLNPSLEPLATRKEAADMNDQGLVKWNATGKKLDTMPLPTINGQKLVATVTPDPLDPSADPTITYGWGGTQELAS